MTAVLRADAPRRSAVGDLARLDQFFGGADAEPFLDHPPREHRALGNISDAQQHFRVPDAQQSLAQIALDLAFQREQAQRVRHARAALADAIGRGFLRQIEIPDEARVPVRFFNRVEAFAL